MLVLQLNYNDRPVYDFCYAKGDSLLQALLHDIATGYAQRLQHAHPDLAKHITISDRYFEQPLKRFIPTTSFGKLSRCGVPEVRATAGALQRAIEQAILGWEEARGQKGVAEAEPSPVVARPPVALIKSAAIQRNMDFREIDHPNDGYFEAREHLYECDDPNAE